MNIELGYDTRIQTVTVPEDRLLAVLEPSAFPPTAGSEEDLIRAALAAPIGAPPLREVVNAGEKAVLVTSDISRPMPTWKVMPRSNHQRRLRLRKHPEIGTRRHG